MYRSKRNQSPAIGIASMKVAEYDKSGASHPEGEGVLYVLSLHAVSVFSVKGAKCNSPS